MTDGEIDVLFESVRRDGRFVPFELIAAGTNSIAVRALQSSTRRSVLLKVAPSESCANLIVREARIFAKLRHPFLPALIDCGVVGESGAAFAAYEFIPGRHLGDVLETERLESREALHLMGQVLDALVYLHSQGYLHCDLKPANIVITGSGPERTAVLVDLGFGRPLGDCDDDLAADETAQFTGTALYAAPEHLHGGAASPASDVYGWGMIFLECLTGQKSSSGSSAGTTVVPGLLPGRVHISDELRRSPVGTLLGDALDKDPAQRGSSRALLDRLRGIEWRERRARERARLSTADCQRRQLTVATCRVLACGAEAPEGLDLVLRERFDGLIEMIESAGGKVVSRQADRLIFVIGQQQAHENDARRAATLALDLVASVRGGSTAGADRTIEVSVGIHTGLVTVDPDATVLTEDLGLHGMVPQIAARLCEYASPGEVLVSDVALSALRGRFEAERVELLAERRYGLHEGYRLTGKRARRDADRRREESPLRGRDLEIQRLRDGWIDALAGRTGAVLMSGEAGIGKSRMVRELGRSLGDGIWIECECTPESRTVPFRPIIDALTSMEESIEAYLGRMGMAVDENMPLFNDLLSRPDDPRYPPLRVSPERRKEMVLEALAELLIRQAEAQPTLLAFENLHWADPSTLELLDLLLRRMKTPRRDAPSLPKLYGVFTTRPEFTPSWAGVRAEVLALQRLSSESATEILRAHLGDNLPESLCEQVLGRADGIPLFVEELARVVSARRAESGDSEPLGEIEVPGSVRELLTARLDAVSPEARETALVASALGQDVEYAHLEAVSLKDADLILEDLEELGRSGLILRQRRTRGDGYVFRHALLRDAAYDLMSAAARTALHARIADCLRSSFPEVERRRPEVVAHHLERAGDFGLSAEYWCRAGGESYRRAAYVESLQQNRHACEVVASLPAGEDRSKREIAVLASLGPAMLATSGYAAPEVEQTFNRAWQICEDLGGEPPMMVLYGVWGVRITRSDRAGVEQILPRLRALIDSSDDPLMVMMGHNCQGAAAYWRGDFPAALRHLDDGLPYHEGSRQGLAYDAGLYAHVIKSHVLWALGRPNEARRVRDRGLEIARERHEPYALSLVLGWGATLAHDCGDLDLARDWGERLIALTLEQRLPFWWAAGAVTLGRAKVLDGETDGGIELIRAGLERYKLMGVMCSYSYFLTYLAEAYLLAGRIAEGSDVVEEALALCDTLVARFHEPELWRLRGELSAAAGDRQSADQCFVRSLAIAEERGALGYALRTANCRADLLARTGEEPRAATVLASLYRRFEPDEQSLDLSRAESTLRGLAPISATDHRP